MRKDKDIAVKMRAQGKSYTEICTALKIPKSTLSDWFTDAKWSEDIKNKLIASANKEGAVRLNELNKIRGIHLKRAYEKARQEAVEEFEALKYNPVFIAGMMLYWGEGDKLDKHQVRLTNTDPEMIRLYVFFLTQVLRIPKNKIGAHILLYPDLDDWLCKAYWIKASSLPKQQFMKSTVIQGKHKTRRLSFGICIIHVSSSYLKVKIQEWGKLLSKELMDKRYYESMGPTAAMV